MAVEVVLAVHSSGVCFERSASCSERYRRSQASEVWHRGAARLLRASNGANLTSVCASQRKVNPPLWRGTEEMKLTLKDMASRSPLAVDACDRHRPRTIETSQLFPKAIDTRLSAGRCRGAGGTGGPLRPAVQTQTCGARARLPLFSDSASPVTSTTQDSDAI